MVLEKHFNMEVGDCCYRPPKNSHQKRRGFPRVSPNVSPMAFAGSCFPLLCVSPGSMPSLDCSVIPLPLKEAYSNEFLKLISLLNPSLKEFPIDNSWNYCSVE